MMVLKPSFSPIKLLVAAAICCASLVSVPTPAAAACQAGDAGCVLPVGRAAPLSVAQPTTATEPIYDDDGGKNWLPLILGVIAAGALLWFLVLDDDDPESP